MRVSLSQQSILSNLKAYIQELSEVEDITKKESATEVARLYIQIKAFYETLYDVTKELTKLKDQMAYQDVPAAFEREQIKTLSLESGYRVTITTLVRASTKDMNEAINWCRTCECGHLDIAHKQPETVLHQLMATVCGHYSIDYGWCQCLKLNAPNAGLVKETINAQTLAAFARSEGEEGRELPENIFTVQIAQNTSVTKVAG